ncbi:MAG TPA: short-chain dehydrogenase [Chitinophagaceae bacterium]
MTNEQIANFLQPKYFGKMPVQINFKSRPSLQGIFIEMADYRELKSKNLWRIVSESKISEYQQSKDDSLARIFNGTDITKLVLV